MATVYIQKEDADHVVLTNNTGADLAQFELTVIGGLVCIADNAIADGDEGSFHVEANLTCQAEDFVSGEGTFGTPDADVFWDPSSGDFSDTSTVGYYKVGIVQTVLNASSVMKFIKDRDAVLVEA